MIETPRINIVVPGETVRSKEIEATPERLYVPRADIITVSGPHAAYKTTAAEIVTGSDKDKRNKKIRMELRVEGLELHTVGTLVRQATESETGKPFEQLFKYPEERDKTQDEIQEAIMRGARIPHPVTTESGEIIYVTAPPTVVEGRYSGMIGAYVAEELRGRRYSPVIERVLFYSSDRKEHIKRAIEKARPKFPDLSDDELGVYVQERERDIIAKAKRLHSSRVRGQNIFKPDIVTKNGMEIYTIKIDTAGKTPHEVARDFHAKLLERGAIIEIKREDFADTPEGEIAYWTLYTLQKCQGLIQEYQCNRYGIKTVDVYKNGELFGQFAACNSDHARNIQNKFRRELDGGLAFSRNGFPIGSHKTT